MSVRVRLSNWPLYPFLFAAHPVLSLLLNNVSKVPLIDTFWSMLVIEVLTLLTLLVCRLICGQWRRAALYTFLIVIALLFFQRFDDAFGLVFDDGLNIWIAAVVWVALLLFVGRVVSRSDSDFIGATTALNAAAVLFLAIPVLGVGWHTWQVQKVQSTAVAAVNRPVPTLTRPANGELPDILYVVLDRYARSDVLKSQYNFNNDDFLGALSTKGFQVLDQGTANYQRTAHSLASTLNLDYLDAASAINGSGSPDWVILYRLLEDFKVWRALKPLGYQYSHLGSWWTPTAMNKFADRNFSWNVVPTFERFLRDQSLPGRLARAAGWQAMDYRRLQCERAGAKFDQLKKIAAENGAAKFVFAHFLMPHPPFVLNEDGSCLTEFEAKSRSRTDNYIDQVRYTNKRLLDLVSRIQGNPDRAAIIILQADEGPWPERIAGDEHTVGMDTTPVKWKLLSGPELLEKQAIFHAIYFPPEKGLAKLPSRMTPVNTFRTIFRQWFGADLPPLPDENFIYLDNNQVLTFERITNKLH